MGKFKYTLGVIAGTLSAIILLAVLEWVNSKIYPLPAGYTMDDMKDPEKATQIVKLMPTAAIISELIIYYIVSYIGSVIAAFVSGRNKAWPSLVMGVIFFGLCIWNSIVLKEAIWFIIACVLTILFAWYGYYSVRKK